MSPHASGNWKLGSADILMSRDVAWRWCNEDYDTPDRVAYVGEPDPEKAPGFYIATGFNAWGISNGTAAGILICDLIVGRRSRWKALYDPARAAPEDFHRDGESQSIVTSIDEIAPGQGGVIEKGAEKIAVCRDSQGKLHVLSATCTPQGMHGDLEQCRPKLGLPLSRLDVFSERFGHPWSCQGSAAAGHALMAALTTSP